MVQLWLGSYYLLSGVNPQVCSCKQWLRGFPSHFVLPGQRCAAVDRHRSAWPDDWWIDIKAWIKDILVGGLKHEFYFSIYLEFHHPNWRTHIFQRGRAQPATSIWKDPILQQPEMLEVCWPWRATARSGSLRGSPCIEVRIAGDDPKTIDFNTEIVYDCLILDDF